jgi:hypothetical protein
MQLEAGKRYTDRRGRVYGPLVKDGVFYAEQVNCPLWSSNGQINHDSLDMDLVAEYVEPVQPEYRMLQDGETVLPDDEYLGYSEKWEKVPSSGNVFKSSIYYPHRRVVPAAPVESPDDWVTQDRVQERPGIDEWRMYTEENGKRTGEAMWNLSSIGQTWFGKHGDKRGACTMEVRCRRKDLPPVPPKTRTVVLQEWICWDDDYPEAVVTQWFSTDPSVNAGLAAEYGHAVATGETRTVEIPVT